MLRRWSRSGARCELELLGAGHKRMVISTARAKERRLSPARFVPVHGSPYGLHGQAAALHLGEEAQVIPLPRPLPSASARLTWNRQRRCQKTELSNNRVSPQWSQVPRLWGPWADSMSQWWMQGRVSVAIDYCSSRALRQPTFLGCQPWVFVNPLVTAVAQNYAICLRR